HTSNINVIIKELQVLNLDTVDEITVPSQQMSMAVEPLLTQEHKHKLQVLPNLVDKNVFRPDGPLDFYTKQTTPAVGKVPLVWVGRFEEGKGFRQFLRALAELPTEYFGIVVVSLEKGPERPTEFLMECAVNGVSDRVELYLNQPQTEIAKLYRWTKTRGGAAVSTSLLESFGYFVAEATACGLPVVAFELPVWKEQEHSQLISSVPIGSVSSLVNNLKAQTGCNSG